MAGWLGARLFGAAVKLGVGAQMGAAWLDRRSPVRLPFPRDPQELAARRDFCEEALRARGAIPAGAAVTAYEVVAIKQTEAFRSQVATVALDWVKGADAGRATALAKFAPRAESLREHAIYVLQKNHVKEAGFYGHLASDPAVPAPRPYHAVAHERSGHLCILMEHVTGAREVPEEDGCPPDLALRAVEAMAALHAHTWGHPERAPFLAPIPEVVIDWFATQFAGPDRALFADLLRAVWRRDLGGPQCVLHGDARVGNILFRDGGATLIDWQAARLGRGVFDVSYLLALSLEPEVRRAHEQALLDRYHESLCEAGVTGYDRDTLAEDHRFATLLTLAFATLPFMSSEASTTAANTAKLHAMGRAWALRMAAVVDDLDLGWVEARTGLSARALRDAFNRSNERVQRA